MQQETTTTHFRVVNGCDSIVELTLAIFPQDTVLSTVTECDSYTWTNGTTYTSSGIYYQVLQSANGCDSTLVLNLTIDSNIPVASVVNDTSLQTISTGISYQWYDCTTGSIIPGSTTASYTPGYNGSFAVIVDDGTCTDTSSCVGILVNGVQSLTQNAGFTLYPNPTKDKFTIAFDTMQSSFDVVVSDLSGRVLINETFKHRSTVDLELTSANGVYLVRILDENAREYTLHVLKY